MNPDFAIALFTVPGALASAATGLWLWVSIACPATLGGTGPFSSGDKTQVTTSYQDAFNSSTSEINSSGDAGNVSLNLGEGAGAGGGMLDGVLPVLVAALFLFGGLYLVTRKN